MSAFIEIPALPPRSIVLDPPLSDDELEELCARTEFAVLERTREGRIEVNAPAGGTSSDANAEITRQLRNWWAKHKQGRVFDSSGGFFLPDGSMLNPDSSYATAEQVQHLSRKEKERFLRLAPAFVIELRSPSDSLHRLEEKMETWMANGVQVGWLLDPTARKGHIYQAGHAKQICSGDRMEGTGPVSGFVLDLSEVWSCFD